MQRRHLHHALITWLAITNDRQQRRFLESHQELLSQQGEQLLEERRASTHARPQQAREAHRLREHLLLLRDVEERERARSLSRAEAIEQAYVNQRGGLAVDIPVWLEEVEQRLEEIAASDLSPNKRAWAEVQTFRDALARAQGDGAVRPEVVAELQRRLWSSLDDTTDPNRLPIEEEELQWLHAALTVYTRELYPVRWARMQHHLAYLYFARVAGSKQENIERVIAHLEQALEVFTKDSFAEQYAASLNNLGNALHHRIEGDPSDNIERAIIAYAETLEVYTLPAYPSEHARSKDNWAIALLARVVGSKRENIETALSLFQEAARLYRSYGPAFHYARVINNLGVAHTMRQAGNRAENMERAIAHLRRALKLASPHFPALAAGIQQGLAEGHLDRVKGQRKQNLERSLRFSDEALQVYAPLESFPAECRNTQLVRAEAAAFLAAWFAVRQDETQAATFWQQAAEAYTQARAAEDLLVALGAGVGARDAILQQGRDATARHGYVLWQLSQLEEAAVAIERGRARWLAEVLAFDAADPERISDPARRAEYTEARQALSTAQRLLQAPLPEDLNEGEQAQEHLTRMDAYHQARAVFDRTVEEIRAANDPGDFLNNPLDATTILQAAQQGGDGHALVYLAATPWGGLALAAINGNPEQAQAGHFAALSLPQLTTAQVLRLIEMRLDSLEYQLVGGFEAAQQESAFVLLEEWPGETLTQKIAGLHAACQTARVTGTLDEVMQSMLAEGTLADLLEQPLAVMSKEERVSVQERVNLLLLQREVERCLGILADLALCDLVGWLKAEGVTSLTLIPCGVLAAFPLTAARVEGQKTLAETLSASVAPSARALLRSQKTTTQRAGVVALGDTRPRSHPLPWSEAEALVVAALARHAGMPSQAVVKDDATLQRLHQVSKQARVIDICCHGVFEHRAPLQSRLLLAQEEELSLRDLLNEQADLHGLRLLILSACQTATLNLQGARDEVRSLAAGMLQSGAQAVLGALWPVDDQATYLLMTRFAELWLPQMEKQPPAYALAEAQRWLRQATSLEIHEWLVTLTRQMRLAPPSAVPTAEPMSAQNRLFVSVRGTRYTLAAAQDRISTSMAFVAAARPYSDPYFWAGFQVMGW